MSAVQSRKIFVNLPVSDLKRSVEFFTELGFTFDPKFTDENATCMIVNDDAFVMLLVQDFFKNFTKKQIVDATRHTETLLALSADSREAVDDLVHKAIAAGGKPSNDPMTEGPMYGWSFQDLDDHMWEVFYMDESAFE